MPDTQKDRGPDEPATSEPAPPKRPKRRRTRRAFLVLGCLCLAGAAGIGAYLVWLLWGTGFTTQHFQAELRPQIQKIIDTKKPSDPSANTVRLPGNAIAIMQVPRIDLDMVVVEGTGTQQLEMGPGHYTNTAYPWQDHGRVAIAGHRTTYLHPFYHLDRMRVGDPIIFETEYGTFRYEVTRVFTIPSAGSGYVLAQTKNPTLVLTTCNPPYSASQRLIVIADRVSPS
jgi:sortase A